MIIWLSWQNFESLYCRKQDKKVMASVSLENMARGRQEDNQEEEREKVEAIPQGRKHFIPDWIRRRQGQEDRETMAIEIIASEAGHINIR